VECRNSTLRCALVFPLGVSPGVFGVACPRRVRGGGVGEDWGGFRLVWDNTSVVLEWVINKLILFSADTLFFSAIFLRGES